MPRDDGFISFFRETPLFFQLFFGLVVLLTLGIIGYVIARGLAVWISNNRAELRNVRCKVVDKRTAYEGATGYSYHYITFEFDDRTRKELLIKPDQFGLIVVGDTGELTYRGERFIAFKRF